MARYAIGDIQGCYHSLMQLLDQLGFKPGVDQLWLVGDVINRGAGSLAVLRWLYQHRNHIQLVLGNHDLHAIAVAHGVRAPHRLDTLQEIFSAEDGGVLLTWLRHQPLMVLADDYAMVHAGLYPQWTLPKAKQLAEEVEQVLHSDHYALFLHAMYGNTPADWQEHWQGVDRWRSITNAFTRMRICDAEGRMEFAFKGEIQNIPPGFYPWFQVPNRQSSGAQTIVCGHWSALGLYQDTRILALDTGCLWGRSLTACNLESRVVTQVPLDLRDRPES